VAWVAGCNPTPVARTAGGARLAEPEDRKDRPRLPENPPYGTDFALVEFKAGPAPPYQKDTVFCASANRLGRVRDDQRQGSEESMRGLPDGPLHSRRKRVEERRRDWKRAAGVRYAALPCRELRITRCR